jgi:uncharacterized protein YaeQ
MALKATIYKADLQIANMDRNYYGDHALTLARHPSETDERMMVRLLAFVLYAQEGLTFGKGLCVDDEPDLWRKDLTGIIKLWIDVGLPDEKWLRKACNRSEQVVLINYGARTTDVWWEQNKSALTRMEKLTVLRITPEECDALRALAKRTMRLQCTVHDGQVLITDGDQTAHIEPVKRN